MFSREPIYKNLEEIQIDSIKMIEYFAEQYLRFIPREIKNFPSHGVDHSINIILQLNDFVEDWELRLNNQEMFLLYLGAWLHDIGCLVSRENHSQESVRIIVGNEGVCTSLNAVDREVLINLRYLILSHRASYSIGNVPDTRGAVRLRLICSIFRLIDACEITCTKCPKNVYELIKDSFVNEDGSPDEEAHAFWRAHKTRY